MFKYLLYIMDPHCAYSYANQRAILDLTDLLKKEYTIDILPGGMWNNAHSLRGGKAIKDFLLPTIIRINEFHNMAISKQYIDLIQDSSYKLSSDVASKAILAVNEVCPEKSIEFANHLMNNQFEKGLRYDIEQTYINALEKFNIDQVQFQKSWKNELMKEKMVNAFKTAKRLTSTFPALFLWKGGAYHLIKSGIFDVAEILNMLKSESEETFDPAK